MDSSPPDEIIATLDSGRRQFLALIEHVRPELHRYCTRMTGSIADGEDVVQETLARAFYELPQLTTLPPLRPWLFRIAHNRAIDHWRHESYRKAETLDAAVDIAGEAAQEPDSVLARNQAVRAALSCFLELAPAQRGCVILKDVLEHSIDEIAVELNLSVQAVKAALHRGRAALERVMAAAGAGSMPELQSRSHAQSKSQVGQTRSGQAQSQQLSPALMRYANLFNAHDWDGVRSMLADDVRLDLVSRRKAAGRRDVGTYFSNYHRTPNWHLYPVWLEGREVLAVRSGVSNAHSTYFIELHWNDERVSLIRDFRHVPYIAQEARFESAN